MEGISQEYPNNTNVDFRKLDRESLIKLLNHYNCAGRHEELSDSDLALRVARIFNSIAVNTDTVVDEFMTKYFSPSAAHDPGRKKPRIVQELNPAMVGEQVAAKVTNSDDNGSWILANVLSYNGSEGIYQVQDEDDPHRVITVPYNNVRRLDDSPNRLRKNNRVLAVFPETTSFYRAVVVKAPRQTPSHWEVAVRFDDDEDETGRVPPRKVPVRFVVRIQDGGDVSDSDA